MKINAHILKFRRLDAMLVRFDPVADRELWIWTAMNAGVHLLNAALHLAHVTDETDTFHTQVEGLYSAPLRDHGTLRDCVHAPGDVMHVGQPPLRLPFPDTVRRASTSLRLIEDLREPLVRGTATPAPGSELRWRDAYESCIAELCGVLRIAREDA